MNDIKQSPQTYDPQKNTFIKRPESKVCAACGQPIAPVVQPMSNYMNNYIARNEGAKAMVINSNEETLVIGGVTVYKVGGKALTDAIKAESLAKTSTPPTSLPSAKTTTVPVETKLAGNPVTVTPAVQAQVPGAASGVVNTPVIQSPSSTTPAVSGANPAGVVVK